MLQVAPSAVGEMAARGLAAPRTGLEDLDDLAPPEVAAPGHQTDPQPVAWCGARHENRHALPAAEAIAAGDQLLDRQLDHIDASQRDTCRPSSCALVRRIHLEHAIPRREQTVSPAAA
jgi:hypothetical protein